MNELLETCCRLEKELVDSTRNCLRDFPVEKYISVVNRWPTSLCYCYECPETREIDAGIMRVFGDVVLENYHKLVLVCLIASADEKITRSDLPSIIQQAFKESFARIIYDVEAKKRTPGRFLITNPHWTPYWAYLGLAALKLIPIGVRFMIPERVNVQASPLRHDASRLCPGRKEAWIYNAHIHPMPSPVPGLLDQARFQRSLRMSAAMLEVRSDYVALLGSSWFYDPKLPDVSPRFGYLPGLLKDIGAILYRVGTNEKIVRQATQASPTRKRLYKEGKYQPTAYTVVCPRDGLIQWARSSQS